MFYFFMDYILLYFIWSFYSIWEDFKIKAYLLVVIQVIASIIGITGLILFTFNIYNPQLTLLWKGLFIIMVLGELISLFYDIKDLKNDPECGGTLVVVICILSIVLLLPAFWINFHYAYLS